MAWVQLLRPQGRNAEPVSEDRSARGLLRRFTHSADLIPPLFWTGFWALVAGSVPMLRATGRVGLAGLTARSVWYSVLLVLVVSAALRLLARPVGRPVWLAAAGLVPVAGFLSGFRGSVTASLIAAVPLAVMCALAPAVFRYHVLRTPGFRPWVFGAFLASQTTSAAFGVYQFAGLTALEHSALIGRPRGLAGHPNTFGMMCVIALLLIVALLRPVSPRVRVALLVAAGVNALGLAASGSLSSMAAGAVGAVVFVIGRRRLALALAAGTALWLAGMAIGLGRSGLGTYVRYRLAAVTGGTTAADDATLPLRIRTYRWALAHIAESPLLGVGMDARSEGTFDGETAVHNVLLHAWYQGGLVLFIWFLAVSLVLLAAVLRAMRSRRGVGSAAVIAAWGAFAATSAFFLQPQYWLPLLFAVAMLPPTDRAGQPPP